MNKLYTGISPFGIPIYLDWTLIILCLLIIPMYKAFSLVLIPVLLFSIVAHEFGHILMARKYGRRSFGVVLSMFGGVAYIEGIDEHEWKIALAGPMVSLCLSLIGFVLCYFIPSFPPILFVLNLVLGVFNLVPMYPMDGGRILHSLLSKRCSKAKEISLYTTYVLATSGICVSLFFEQVFLALILGYVLFLAWSQR